MDNKEFIKTVKSLSAKEIIMTMVEGLMYPVVNIDMDTYGHLERGICYGCVATNFICRVHGFSKEEAASNVYNTFNISEPDTGEEFISQFEMAINELRSGGIEYYNQIAKDLGIAVIKDNGRCLPHLSDNYTEEQLEAYVKLGEYQDEQGKTKS